MHFAIHFHLTQHQEWAQTHHYIRDPANMLHLVQASSQGGKFKFVLEVAKFIPHALYLDWVNGNQLWVEAICKELKQITYYKTF